jgi:hypothetical protein
VNRVRNGSARWASVAIALVSALAAGCQQNLRKTVAAIDSAYSAGEYDRAAKRAETALAENGDDAQDRLVWLLESGRTQQAAGGIDGSITAYDRAVDEVRPYLDSKAEATITEALVTTAVNQTMRIYRGTPPERIMLCTLQGANLLQKGDLARARVELNRAADFQQDAVQRHAKDIASAQEKADKEWKQKGWNQAIAANATESVRKAQAEQTASAPGAPEPTATPTAPAPAATTDPATRGYASFANPFTSYLRAVFLVATSSESGDRQNARADLRAVQEMMPGHAAAAADIALIDAGTAHGSAAVTWVFFLTGMAPDYKEFRLDIPIPVGRVNYVSAAFPILRKHGDFVSTCAVAGEGGARSELLADVDAMVETDFDSRLPLIVTQEIISSAAKAAATWAASQAAYNSSSNSTAGILVQIAGIAYQAASTAADLRCWSTMPKQVAVLRVPTPADGRLELVREGGAPLCTLDVRAGAPNIAFVTLPSAKAMKPSVLMYRGGDAGAAPSPTPPAAPAAAPSPSTVTEGVTQ